MVICTRDFAKPALAMYERLRFVRAPELDRTPLPEVRLLGLRLDLNPAVRGESELARGVAGACGA